MEAREKKGARETYQPEVREHNHQAWENTNREKQKVLEGKYVASDTRSMGKDGDRSRFSILEDMTKEDTIMESILILKQKIQNMLGPSGTKGKTHENQGAQNKLHTRP